MGGRDKATLRIDGERIIDRQLALLRQVAEPVFVVARGADRFPDLPIPVVCDLRPGAGPLGGIYTAILSSPRPRTLVVACDLPFLTRPLLEELARPREADLVIPRSARGYEPLCAVWSAACAPAIRRRLDRGELTAALVAEDVRVEEIGPDILGACDPRGLLFVNVNTPHDYERARGIRR